MIHACQNRISSLPRRSGAVVGIGAAAGGMLVAAFAQLATAPDAQADEITNGLTNTFAAANTDFMTASTDFAGGDVPDGLGYSFAGLNDYLLAPIADVAYNGYQELQGVGGAGTFFTFPELADPTTLAATSADVTNALGLAASDFTTAGNDFATSDFIDGASFAFQAIGQLVDAPEVELIGLTDTLLSSV